MICSSVFLILCQLKKHFVQMTAVVLVYNKFCKYQHEQQTIWAQSKGAEMSLCACFSTKANKNVHSQHLSSPSSRKTNLTTAKQIKQIRIFNIMDLKSTLKWCNMNGTKLKNGLIYIIKWIKGRSSQHICPTLLLKTHILKVA